MISGAHNFKKRLILSSRCTVARIYNFAFATVFRYRARPMNWTSIMGKGKPTYDPAGWGPPVIRPLPIVAPRGAVCPRNEEACTWLLLTQMYGKYRKSGMTAKALKINLGENLFNPNQGRDLPVYIHMLIYFLTQDFITSQAFVF